MSAQDDIIAERRRQDAKWGEQNHEFPLWMAILAEELGEMSKEYLDRKDPVNFRNEVIQSCAVLMAMLECGDRNGWFQSCETSSNSSPT